MFAETTARPKLAAASACYRCAYARQACEVPKTERRLVRILSHIPSQIFIADSETQEALNVLQKVLYPTNHGFGRRDGNFNAC